MLGFPTSQEEGSVLMVIEALKAARELLQMHKKDAT